MTSDLAIHILDNLKPTNTKTSFDAYIVGKAITMAIKALEPTDVLDNVRAEISEQRDNVIPCIAYPADAYADGKIDAYNRCLSIIDKYRKEQSNADSD